MKQFKSNNGITLIALIITIIILLILAMVTINILINQGIIGHAQNAVETYDEKQVKEDIALSYDEYKMQKFGANAKSLYDFFKDKYGAEHVTDNGDGSITVSVTSNGKTYTVKLKEDGSMESMTGLSLDKSKITLEYEEETPATDTITATLTDVSGDVTWSIADNSIATISATTGNQITVTSVKEGTTTITAKCGKYTKTCEVETIKKLPIGEYINYDCFTGVDSTKLYYKSPKEKTGYSSDQEFQVTENPKWKILGKNENGSILITTSDPIYNITGEGIHLGDKAGYATGLEELDKVSQIYSHGNNAVEGRSIKVEDFNQLMNFTARTGGIIFSKGEDGYIYQKGNKTSEKNFTYYDEELKEWKTLAIGEDMTLKTKSYYSDGLYGDSKEKKLLRYGDDGTTELNYYLASRTTLIYTGSVYFCILEMDRWGVDYHNFLYQSNGRYGNGNNSNRSHAIRPVVTLSSDVTIGEKVNDVWQIVEK